MLTPTPKQIQDATRYLHLLSKCSPYVQNLFWMFERKRYAVDVNLVKNTSPNWDLTGNYRYDDHAESNAAELVACESIHRKFPSYHIEVVRDKIRQKQGLDFIFTSPDGVDDSFSVSVKRARRDDRGSLATQDMITTLATEDKSDFIVFVDLDMKKMSHLGKVFCCPTNELISISPRLKALDSTMVIINQELFEENQMTYQDWV